MAETSTIFGFMKYVSATDILSDFKKTVDSYFVNSLKGRFDLPLNVPLYDQKPCLEWFQYVHRLMNSRQSFLLF